MFHSIKSVPFLILPIICLFAIGKSNGDSPYPKDSIFMETSPNCMIQYEFANMTINEFGEDWKVELEKRRSNLTIKLTQCRDELNITSYPSTVRDFLNYEIDVANCPGARTNWVIVSIVFIIAFLIALGSFATVSILFYRNLKRNGH